MKVHPGIAGAALFVLMALPAAAEIAGAEHVGYTGEIRALYLNGRTLWVATGGGIVRYDVGNDKVVDQLTVRDGLPSNSVRTVTSDGDRVFVGTDEGLAIFGDGEPTIYTNTRPGPYDSLNFHDIRAIDFGRDGNVYLGTYGHGLGVMTPDDGHAITREDSLLDNKVYGVAEAWTTDEDGVEQCDWYYATSMGLCAFRDSVWVGFQAGAGIPRGEVRRMFELDGAYYLLVGVGGVYRFRGGRAADLSPRGVLPADDIADMTLDSRGLLWVVGRFGGIAVRQSGNWKRVSEGERAVNEAPWRSAWSDDAGGVFFGADGGLIASIRDNILDMFRIPTRFPSGAVRELTPSPAGIFATSGTSIVTVDSTLSVSVDETPPGIKALATDGNGDLWAAGRWGIYQRHEGRYTEFVHDILEPEPSFTALCFDGGGRLWTALRSGAVYRYDGEVWLRMGEPAEVLGGAVDGLRVSGLDVWAFSGAGVARYDPRAWALFSADSLGGPVVDLAIGPGGAVVAATADRLWLFRADSDDWQPVSVAGGGNVRPFRAPPSRAIRRVTFDPDGNIYLGTSGGLALIGPAGVRWLGPADGIGGRAVADVLVDDRGALWIGFGSDGLTRVPVKSLW